jgi:hypothetical protein
MDPENPKPRRSIKGNIRKKTVEGARNQRISVLIEAIRSGSLVSKKIQESVRIEVSGKETRSAPRVPPRFPASDAAQIKMLLSAILSRGSIRAPSV